MIPDHTASIAGMEISDEALAEIAMILSMRRSFEMSVYKDKCMKRRVSIRVRATRCATVAEYCCLLRQSEQELDQLQRVLTIHVSQFFRNPTTFDLLRDRIFPGLFAAAAERGADCLRMWCLGCAAGEEPFSLAILLREHFSRELEQCRVAIRGTDIDQAILAAARRGEYGEERLKEVPPGLRERYFTTHNGLFRLDPAIREMVDFEQGDIIAMIRQLDADLVLCRNTLIYFSRPEQERILVGLAERLEPGGILVLGKSETLVGEARRHFAAVCLTERIYRRI